MKKLALLLTTAVVIAMSLSSASANTNVVELKAKAEGSLPFREYSDSYSYQIGDVRLRIVGACSVDDYGLLSSVEGCSVSIEPSYKPRHEEPHLSDYAELRVGQHKVKLTEGGSYRYGRDALNLRSLKRALLDSKDPTLTIERVRFGYGDLLVSKELYRTTGQYRLKEFKALADKALKNAQHKANGTVAERNSVVVVCVIILVILLGMLAAFINRKAIPAAKEKAEQVMEKAEELKEKAEQRKVRKIAEEEAIRATVREQVSEANSEDKEVLKEQIKDALDAGDTKTAMALTRILDSSK
ncbi:hypothetical protein [Vibrio europaeus]|uniref:hypothetical protein n=1 Tax=Vibrio europaeus TaxID=300876 RepID=UPI00148E5791|nr:hypothetical protein [Vibrio europaeus]NOH23866.1 hypothetical protein [Vibrio europaeus]